jgi:predicted phage tail protein
MSYIAGSGGGGCFKAGTLVQKPNGLTTPIEQIKVGDIVLSFDDKGIISESVVEQVHVHTEPEPIIKIEFWNGSIHLTPNHWVLNQYYSFVEAGSLTIEDALVDGMGHLRPIKSIIPQPSETVYNLTVSDNHTFIADSICVHNGGYRNRFPVAGSGGGGGGKGGGGGRAPVETPDNLHSKQYARVLDLVSEGEIEGLVNGLKSVYLDDTPIESADGTLNFSGVSVVTRNGTQAQDYVPGFGTVEAETSVSVEVKSATPVTRQITNTNADAVRITLSTPVLSFQDPNTGDLSGSEIQLSIDINDNNTGWKSYPIRQVSGTIASDGSQATGTSSILSYSFDINWTGLTNLTLQNITYKVEYKLVSSGTWLSLGTFTESGTGNNVASEVPIYDGENVNIVGYTTQYTITPPSYSRRFSASVSEGIYEFKVTKLSGSGMSALSAISTTANTGIDVISGKTTSKYQRAYRLELEGTGPWQVRVTKVTPDATTSNLRNNLYWDSYTEIVDSKLSYPNSALVAISVDSEQFSNIPTRGYEIKGVKVRIPDNYNPITRIYTGIWSGTFAYAWTDNPAWCFYDICTNTRYGLGDYLSEGQIDKWTLYSIAQYCDELVPNGFGGQEPRFTCNMYLQTREEAFKVINTMAAIFRAMVYWASGTLVPVQDAPTTPVDLYTPANVIDGMFTYQGASAKAIHTVALVSWNDPADMYKSKIEYVENTSAINRYGVIQTEINAIGCTSRGQAHRVGEWLLYTEQNESETITFKTGLSGCKLSPGNTFKVSDPTRTGTRLGGRVSAATTTEITIDSSVTIEPGITYYLYTIQEDGTVLSRNISNSPGPTNILTLVSALPSAPIKDSMWILAHTQMEPETWRVIGVKEDDNNTVEVSALLYNDSKYSHIEQDTLLDNVNSSGTLYQAPPAVYNITVVESLYLVGLGVVGTRATLSWSTTEGASYYTIKYTKANGNPVEITSRYSSIDIAPIDEAEYTFTIIAYNLLGVPSQPTSYTYTIKGKTTPPNNVSGFNLAALGNQAYITWDASTDLDVQVGGYIRIRYTPDTLTPSWNNATDIGPVLPGTSTSTMLPLLSGTYLAKWVDSTYNASVSPTSIITDAANYINQNVVATVMESPSFLGTSSYMILDGTSGYLKMTGTSDIDSMLTNVDTWGYIDSLGGIGSSAYYNFQNYFDLGSIQTSRLSAILDINAIDITGYIDSRTINIDEWLSIDGSLVDDVNATLFVSTTNDNPSGSPTWSNWHPFYVGDWTARAFKFRLEVYNYSQGAHNIEIKSLGVVIDMPDRLEYANDVVSSGVTAITITPPYMAPYSLGITAQNMDTGDYYQITSKGLGGFTITFYNSAGTPISRTFDWQARGY